MSSSPNKELVQRLEQLRRQGRSRAELRRQGVPKAPWPWKPWALLFGLLVVVALCLDLQRFARHVPAARTVTADLQELVLGESDDIYVHPKGWFSIRKPKGWRIRTREQSAPYDVVLVGPTASDISIMTTAVSYDSLPPLLEEINRSEQMANLSIVKEPFFFQGIPAVQRVAHLKTQTLLAIDFVKDHVAHHIMCGLPPEHFDKYKSVLLDWLNRNYTIGTRETERKTETNDVDTGSARSSKILLDHRVHHFGVCKLRDYPIPVWSANRVPGHASAKAQ